MEIGGVEGGEMRMINVQKSRLEGSNGGVSVTKWDACECRFRMTPITIGPSVGLGYQGLWKVQELSPTQMDGMATYFLTYGALEA